jgi:hypothetical protein
MPLQKAQSPEIVMLKGYTLRREREISSVSSDYRGMKITPDFFLLPSIDRELSGE